MPPLPQPTDKMSSLLQQRPQALPIVCRFGIPMGVGDKTIDTVCQENHIHTGTFLAIVTHLPSHPILSPEEIDLPTLNRYLSSTHTYFVQFRLPRLRRLLIEAINPADTNSRIPMLILRHFDDYVKEIHLHIRHEEEGKWELHYSDDQHITDKLAELINLIIKYFPADAIGDTPFANEMVFTVLTELYDTEEAIRYHCSIEDDILRPALACHATSAQAKVSAPTEETDELSEREKEVLTELVKGLSNKEIADVLCISTHTVITHRKNIAKKLNIHSVAGLTIYAIVNHLITIDS